MKKTCGDGKRAVLHRVDGSWLSCLYKYVWESAVKEELSCKRELGNHQDPFADWAKIAEE